MPADPLTLAIRFGYGLSPLHPPPADADALMAALTGPDRIARQYRQPPSPLALSRVAVQLQAKRAMNRDETEANRRALRAANRQLAEDYDDARRALMARAALSPDPFRERLAAFWTDHFTVHLPGGRWRSVVPAYVESAIRPFVAGRFADMLRAVVTHPAMLVYLDQFQSVGPQSRTGRQSGRGLNENLARELMELHTLGVDGGYTQDDVRELAELLTGLSISDEGFAFKPQLAEPGPEVVLGRRYGGAEPARLDEVLAAVDDLARHPATAAHLARKLAVHFVSDTPDPDLVAALAARWRETDGDLAAVAERLVTHPASAAPLGAKAKRPQEFLLSALRALGPVPRALTGMGRRTLDGVFSTPLRAMGQAWLEAPGPDGWPEEAGSWITPQGLAARITWAMAAPRVVRPDLPDPRDFVETALGPMAARETRFAARAAETGWEGVGLVLASPEFNRR